MKKNLKIAITGAAGFLGKSAMEYLNAMPHITELRVLSTKTLPQEFSSPRIRSFVGSMSQVDLIQDLIHGTDAVLHFAGRGSHTDVVQNPTDYLKEQLSITGNLLEAMVREKVSRIIYPSSGSATYRFDTLRKVPFHEGSETEFRSPYALAKLTTEQLLHFYKRTQGISPVILRLSNVFGRYQLDASQDGFMGMLISKTLSGEEVKIRGSLDVVRDFIYIEDVLRVIDGFLQHPEHNGVYNVASGMGVSLREVITNVERVSHRKVRVSFSGFNPSDTPWCVLNTSKLQRALSWTCRNSLQDGVRLLWERIQQASKESPDKIAA